MFCFTNVTNCCRDIDGSNQTRDWYFPNDSRVGYEDDFPISRSTGPNTIILHRDNDFELSGVYRCHIHGSDIYFGIYPENKGK